MKKYNPAKFKHTVTFQNNVKVKDSGGIMDDDWQNLHTDIPCQIKSLSGKEMVELGQVFNLNIKKIIIHEITNLNESMRCLINNVYYGISSIIPDDDLGLYQEITIEKINV
jgi:head-tail adaptor